MKQTKTGESKSPKQTKIGESPNLYKYVQDKEIRQPCSCVPHGTCLRCSKMILKAYQDGYKKGVADEKEAITNSLWKIYEQIDKFYRRDLISDESNDMAELTAMFNYVFKKHKLPVVLSQQREKGE